MSSEDKNKNKSYTLNEMQALFLLKAGGIIASDNRETFWPKDKLWTEQ